MGNSLLAVRGINHKYIVVEGERGGRRVKNIGKQEVRVVRKCMQQKKEYGGSEL